MAEARKRNPSIVLGALAWTWPGYIGAGTNNPWTNASLTSSYITDWVRGARDAHNLSIDFIDAVREVYLRTACRVTAGSEGR